MYEDVLPVGIQSFSKIRKKGLRYVDKTHFASKLAEGSGGYFLSRPHRFGKSLFVDMLKELFEGNETLFRGLAIHGEWDWSIRYPVIQLNFGDGNYSVEGELEERTVGLLRKLERKENLHPSSKNAAGRFGDLIEELAVKTGQPVAVLVDEYDKPILGTIGNPKLEQSNRQFLQAFYSALKVQDTNIWFCFVTGVSRFAHIGLFSGANHLRDITLESEYSTICGYTESDIDEVFSSEIAGLDRSKVRDWYNGYYWRGEEKVYNPFAILLLMTKQEFGAWWYSAGTPSFVIQVLKQRGLLPINLENLSVTDSQMLASEIKELSIGALLLQSGYMTIVDETVSGNTIHYKLGYPNCEVREALNSSLLYNMLLEDDVVFQQNSMNLVSTMEQGDVKGVEDILYSVFAGIPHQWHIGGKAARYESYFASVVYGFFAGSGLDVRVEDSTNIGRVDLAVFMRKHIYLFEFKLVGKGKQGKSMEQMRAKKYAEIYKRYGLPIHLVGIDFCKKTRNIVKFRTGTS